MLRITLQRAASITRSKIVPSTASTALAVQISKRGYHENIVEHYENPQNVGSLDKNDESVGTVRFICNNYIFFSK